MTQQKRLTHPCWWCGAALYEGYATVPDPLGNALRCHQNCAEAARAHFRRVTAQPSQEEVRASSI